MDECNCCHNRIYGNEIYNQTSNLTTTALAATGITIAGTSSSPLTAYVYNNFISDLDKNIASSGSSVMFVSIFSLIRLLNFFISYILTQ